MAESLFDIFGDHLSRQAVNNVSRQTLSNIENMGKSVKSVSSGPIKPNEPVKKGQGKGEPKKSFLSNMGKALQSTPVRKVFTPRAMNVGPMIYTDENESRFNLEEIEFTKPTEKYDYQSDLFDFFPKISQYVSPPSTPPPETHRYSMDLDSSYKDEFFTDDFSNDSLPDDDLGLPALY